jgi:pyridoxal phosphate enzyme (YggS family)
MTVFGENRVQEAEPKVAAIPGLHWVLVGHLQSNKAARAVEIFGDVMSVDSVPLARRLGELAQAKDPRFPLWIYLQVNVDHDPNKHGFDPDGLEAAVSELSSVPGLEMRGLMTVGRQVERPEDARPTFVRLRQLSEEVRSREPGLGPELSMGMSHDFEVAVEEGATLVRLGSALFGARPPG